jgi:hypothetical protein
MRTTVTLDPETEALLREEIRRTGASFKSLINACILRALRNDLEERRSPEIDDRPLPMGPPYPWARNRLPTHVAEDIEVTEYLEEEARKRRHSQRYPKS